MTERCYMYGERLDLPRPVSWKEFFQRVDRVALAGDAWFLDLYCRVNKEPPTQIKGLIPGAVTSFTVKSCRLGYGMEISLGDWREVAAAHESGRFSYVYVDLDSETTTRAHDRMDPAYCRCRDRVLPLSPDEALAWFRRRLVEVF